MTFSFLSWISSLGGSAHPGWRQGWQSEGLQVCRAGKSFVGCRCQVQSTPWNPLQVLAFLLWLWTVRNTTYIHRTCILYLEILKKWYLAYFLWTQLAENVIIPATLLLSRAFQYRSPVGAVFCRRWISGLKELCLRLSPHRTVCFRHCFQPSILFRHAWSHLHSHWAGFGGLEVCRDNIIYIYSYIYIFSTGVTMSAVVLLLVTRRTSTTSQK